MLKIAEERPSENFLEENRKQEDGSSAIMNLEFKEAPIG